MTSRPLPDRHREPRGLPSRRATRPARAWDGTAASRLAGAIDALGLTVPSAPLTAIERYAGLLLRWNATFNLLGATDPDDLVDLHLADSLAALPALDRWLPRGPIDLHDIGSGAGLPGLILAISRPQWSLTLVEPVSKKAAFLRQTVAELRLPNVRVVEGRVEALPPAPAAPVRHFICRAFTALDRFHALCQPVSHPDSLLFAMKAAKVHDEIAALPAGLRVHATESLPTARPDLDRTLVVLAARAATPH